ncbi:NAD binding domain of 6-phosphogluconate dehydrogenase-domain-containing protein [Nemania sp. FL0916]|nr:NAD binding domain of 6-phosphogluconate dehydrogenase-domain-containing protein [Nemania sp. FL0916]
MAPQLMFIGLGNMGRAMSKNLVEKGNLDKPLILYNRTKKRAEDLAASLPAGKTEVVSSIAEGVKKADIIFNIVSNDAAVKEAVSAILESDVTGKVVVDCSTIHPDTTKQVAADLAAKGAEFVASPVFGAPAMADAGKLIFVPAGTKSAIDRLRPYFTGVMGRAEIPFDDRAPETALQLKLLGNSFILNMVTVLGEGLTLGEKSGVGVEPVKQFVDLLFGGVHSAYAARMVDGVYWKMDEPLFSADNARKDAGHAINMAAAVGVDLKLAKLGDSYLQTVADHAGGSKGDIAGIYGAVRKQSSSIGHNELSTTTLSPLHLAFSTSVFSIENPHLTAAKNLEIQIETMAQGYSVFIGLVVVAALCVGAWFLSPKGENQTTWRSSLIIAFISCYLMWFVTFMAQLHPLIEPRRTTVKAGFQHE